MKKVLLFSCALAATVIVFKAFSGNASKSGGTGVRGGFVAGDPQYAGGGGNGFVGSGEGGRTFADGGGVGNGFTDDGGGLSEFTDGGGGVKNG